MIDQWYKFYNNISTWSLDIYGHLYLPLTVSLAVARTPSAENTMVPVSSSVRLDRVRLWIHPLVLTRHWLFGFTRMPSFCQTPSTSVWESSTSKVAVSRSKVSWSVRPLRIEILRAALEDRERWFKYRQKDSGSSNSLSQCHSAQYCVTACLLQKPFHTYSYS